MTSGPLGITTLLQIDKKLYLKEITRWKVTEKYKKRTK